jgi:mRNA interferase MazF
VVKARERPPERGDVVWIDFSPQAGHEQSGRRPGLVVSPGLYNGRAGLAILCPISSRVKGYPFEVALPSGLPVQGVVLADQARSIDWRARRSQRTCRVPESVTSEVLAKLGTLLR